MGEGLKGCMFAVILLKLHETFLDTVGRVVLAGVGGAMDFVSLNEEKLYNATQAVFSVKRYHEVTISDIIDAAGVGKGTFYRSFDHKEDCFTKTLMWLFTKNAQILNELYINEKMQLFPLIQFHLQNIFNQRTLSRNIIIHYYSADFQYSHQIGEAYSAIFAIFGRALADQVVDAKSPLFDVQQELLFSFVAKYIENTIISPDEKALDLDYVEKVVSEIVTLQK